MRKSASELIRDLEGRIARLEKQSSRINLKSLATHIGTERSDGTGTVGFVEYDAQSQTVSFFNGDYDEIKVPVDKLLAQFVSEEMGSDLLDSQGNAIH